LGPLFNYGVSGLREDRTLETKTGPTLNGDGDRDGLRGLKLKYEDERGSNARPSGLVIASE